MWNKLGGDRFIPGMHLQQPGYSACGSFTEKKKTKIFKKQQIWDIYQTSLTKLSFSTISLMDILRIYPEEQLMLKYSVIKH